MRVIPFRGHVFVLGVGDGEEGSCGREEEQVSAERGGGRDLKQIDERKFNAVYPPRGGWELSIWVSKHFHIVRFFGEKYPPSRMKRAKTPIFEGGSNGFFRRVT